MSHYNDNSIPQSPHNVLGEGVGSNMLTPLGPPPTQSLPSIQQALSMSSSPQTGPLPPMSLPPTPGTPFTPTSDNIPPQQVQTVSPQMVQLVRHSVPGPDGPVTTSAALVWMTQHPQVYQQLVAMSQARMNRPQPVVQQSQTVMSPAVASTSMSMVSSSSPRFPGPPPAAMAGSSSSMGPPATVSSIHFSITTGASTAATGLPQATDCTAKPKPKRKRPPRPRPNRNQARRPTQAELKQKAEDELYSGKMALLKKAIKALVFKNGALCDEVARLNQRIVTVGEEKKLLVRRMIQHERLRMRREDNARKRQERVQEQLALDDLPLAALKAHTLGQFK